MVWTVTADAEEFWRAADSHLRAHRVGSTVVLTIVDALRRRGPAPGDPPRLAWWDAGDGASAVVEHLAAAWDASTEVVVAERLHRLDRLRPPAAPSPTRPARDADRAVLWSWLREFHREATPDDPLPPRAALDAAIEEGRVQEVLLFTDLANPTSNALYARLGFVGVADLVDAALVPKSSTQG